MRVLVVMGQAVVEAQSVCGLAVMMLASRAKGHQFEGQALDARAAPDASPVVRVLVVMGQAVVEAQSVCDLAAIDVSSLGAISASIRRAPVV